MDANGTICASDSEFGPLTNCRDGADFTLYFESIILSICPSVIFILLAALRAFRLSQKPVRIHAQIFQTIKLGVIAAYLALQIAQTVLYQSVAFLHQATSLAASALRIVDAVCFLALSLLEHRRSWRSSILLTSYLFISLLTDIVQVRTLWILLPGSTVANLFTATAAIKFTILFIEAQSKRRWIPSDVSKEASSGALGLSFLWWLKDMIVAGYRDILITDNLSTLDQNLSAEAYQDRFDENWRHLEKDSHYRLIRALVLTLRWPLCKPMIARIALGVFTFCQPFLITSLLAQMEASRSSNSKHSYGFIIAAALVYLGLAISSSVYWYLHQRFLAMARASLDTAIYRTSLRRTIQEGKDSSAITLVNSDVMRIQGGFRDLHECWASVVEVAIASWLLERKLGAAFVAPIIVVVLCFFASLLLGKFMGKKQGVWMKALQKRVAITTSVISAITSIKISGFSPQIQATIQSMRETELDAAKHFRAFITISTVIAFTPILISPVASFAATSKQLDIVRVFSALSYIQLLCNPLSQLFQSVPQMMAALTCLERIENFLGQSTHTDSSRSIAEKQSIDSSQSGPSGNSTASFASLGWAEGQPVLQDVSLDLRPGQVIAIIGPIASGKSTLCKGLLGEVPFCRGDRAHLSGKRLAYCDQRPFVWAATIRDNIVGFGSFNASWYKRVVKATCLTEDIASMEHGDDTKVGTNGSTLSGGQRQRVSIARALYAKPQIAILDDILSGLDPRTAHELTQSVFGPRGLFRELETAVVLTSQTDKFASIADCLVILEAGRIVWQGPTEDCNSSSEARKVIQLVDAQSSKDEVMLPASSSSPSKQESSSSSTKEKDQSRQIGDFSVYNFYFSRLGSLGHFMLLPFLLLASAFGVLYNFSSVWLEFWSSETRHEQGTARVPYYLGIYFALQIGCLLVLALFVGYSSIFMAPKASSRLHLDALRTLLNAPLLYFSSTHAGIITNYFVQDISIIDNDFQNSLSNTILTGTTAIGQAAVIAVSSVYVLIAYPVIAGAMYVVQKVYLRTSRQLRLLDLELKAPLSNHFLETIEGLVTIRAYNGVSPSIETYNRLFDLSQQPAYLLAMAQQWLMTVINTMVAVLAIIFVTLATQLNTSAGFTGVGLVSLMSFGEMLGNLLRCFTQLEVSTGAIMRLRKFGEDVASEARSSDTAAVLDESWPKSGKVELRDVHASYQLSEESGPRDDGATEKTTSRGKALCNISLTITARSKVAVYGRTGSGKSSLINLFNRVLETSSGEILIDDIDLRTIDPSTLRSRIVTLPQHPFFPAGFTFRQNISGQFSSTEAGNIQETAAVEHAVRSAGLEEMITEAGGLDTECAAESLSRGQAQLLSLARAIFRARMRNASATEGSHSGILLLDEFNAGLDDVTDDRVHEIIAREFATWTVFCVTHRFRNLERHFESAIVMEQGKVIESGAVASLMADRESRLRHLSVDLEAGKASTTQVDV